jgi:hypothetical protein
LRTSASARFGGAVPSARVEIDEQVDAIDQQINELVCLAIDARQARAHRHVETSRSPRQLGYLELEATRPQASPTMRTLGGEFYPLSD